MTKWQYVNVVVTVSSDCSYQRALEQIDRINNQMNKLGEEGWELVQQARNDKSQIDAENLEGDLSDGSVYLYTFKRPQTLT